MVYMKSMKKVASVMVLLFLILFISGCQLLYPQNKVVEKIKSDPLYSKVPNELKTTINSAKEGRVKVEWKVLDEGLSEEFEKEGVSGQLAIGMYFAIPSSVMFLLIDRYVKDYSEIEIVVLNKDGKLLNRSISTKEQISQMISSGFLSEKMINTLGKKLRTIR